MIIAIFNLKQRFPKLKGKLRDYSNCPEDFRMLSDVMAENLLEAAPLFKSLVGRFMARSNPRLHFLVFFWICKAFRALHVLRRISNVAIVGLHTFICPKMTQ